MDSTGLASSSSGRKDKVTIHGLFATLPGYAWMASGDEGVLEELEIIPPGTPLDPAPPSRTALWESLLRTWIEKWERGIEEEEERFSLLLFSPLFSPSAFKGGRDLPWAQRVYLEVSAIPRGEVSSYGEIARALGRPKASRAVAWALKMNPLPLLIPCHRVVGKNDIGGYSARGGIQTKILLLTREGALPSPKLSPREP